MADDESRIEPKRSPWTLPGMILWGFAPAILMCLSALDQDGDGIALVEMAALIGLVSMPIVLYAWSVTVLRNFGKRRTFAAAALLGIPLSIGMCIANSAAAFAGCSVLFQIIPNEPIL